MRTTIKRRVRPGRALYGMVWTPEQKRQDRLQKAIRKRTAGGRQVHNTQQRRADTTARLTDTTRTAPPNHEEVLQRLEILCMEREDVRPAEPAPPRFVIGDFVHIRPEFWGAFGIGVPMRRALAAKQIPRGCSRLGRRFLFRPCKRQDHFRIHPQCSFDARMSRGSRVCGANRKARGGPS